MTVPDTSQPEAIWARLDSATLYADGSSPCVARTKEFANGTKYVRADVMLAAEILRPATEHNVTECLRSALVAANRVLPSADEPAWVTAARAIVREVQAEGSQP